MQKVRKGRYRHYKGNLYRVIGVARDTEDTSKELVVYQAQYNSREFGRNALWVRPAKMFMEKVIVDGRKVSRFRFIGP